MTPRSGERRPSVFMSLIVAMNLCADAKIRHGEAGREGIDLVSARTCRLCTFAMTDLLGRRRWRDRWLRSEDRTDQLLIGRRLAAEILTFAHGSPL